MRWLLTLAMVFAVSFAAEAKKKPAQFEGQLLTYGQLMKLSSTKRMKYIQDVRELLIYMEKAQGKYEISSNSEMRDLKEYVAGMLKMMAVFPEAAAAEADAPEVTSMTPRWVAGQGWTCVGTLREGIDIAFDPSLGTCAYRQRVGMRSSKSFWFSPGRNGESACPTEDATAVFTDLRGSRKCIPNEAWSALSPARRRDLSSGERLNGSVFNTPRGKESPDHTMDIVLGGGTHKPDGTLVNPPAGRPPGEIPPAGEGPIAGTNISGGAPPTPAPACVKPTFDCENLDAAAKEAKIREFRADNDNVCIAGGFFTTYRQGKKRVGNCDWKKEFRFPGAANAIPCAGKNEAMCNPAVFCLGLKVDDKLLDLARTDQAVTKSVSPDGNVENALRILNGVKVKTGDDKMVQSFLCAKVGQDLTEQCDKAMKAHIDGQVSGFTDKKPRGEKYIACDPTKMSGLKKQAEWDAFAADVRAKYRQWCANTQQKFTALFCTECKIIADRIMAMNNAATGEPCVAAPAAAVPGAPTEGAPEAIPEGHGAG